MNFQRVFLAAAAMAFLCTSSAALAQGGNLSIRCMALTNVPVPEVLVQTPDGLAPLEFSAVQPTDPVRARFANPLPLYDAEAAGDEKKGPPPTMVKLPANSREILLLAWTVGESARYLAIKDDFSNSKQDDWLLINTTNSPIAIQVGQKSKPKQVGPSTYEAFKITAPVNEAAAITAVVQEEKKVRTIFTTYWPIYTDQRCIIFFVADGDKIRVRPVWDQIPQTAAAAGR